MKKFTLSAVLISALLLTSCGVNGSLILNQNQNATQVHLASDNFKVVDKISGSADVPYVLFIGGMNRRELYKEAYSSMLEKAKLENSSRAIINVLTEEHVGGVPPFYYKRTITVSANVIEFTR
ncbi:MAG TPA: DUF6567 family protein [Chryseosolibacter sp.]|nr:DUF6567 family protein [Chryseosolibacter sp.]